MKSLREWWAHRKAKNDIEAARQACMENVVVMPGSPIPVGVVVPETVALLEEILEKAMRGEVSSVALTYTDATSTIYTRWESNREFFKLQGAVAQLLHNMCER